MLDDLLGYFMGAIVFGVIAFVVIVIGVLIVQEIRWADQTSFDFPCTLISVGHKGSTLQTHPVPSVTSNGSVGIGVVTTGESESFTTIWDAGKYGRLVSTDEEVFRFAKEKSVLRLKELDGEIRVVGIKNL